MRIWAIEWSGVACIDYKKEVIRALLTDRGKQQRREFAHFNWTVKLKCELSESCALHSLTPQVARSDVAARAALAAQLCEIAAWWRPIRKPKAGLAGMWRTWLRM